MTEILVIALLVAASVVALYLAHRASGARSARGAFARVPLTTVEGAEPPAVRRLSGTARPIGEVPVSEASGRPYLAQDLRIVAHDGGGGSASRRGASRSVDFLLEDATGTALVRAEDALVALDRDFEAPRTTLDKVPWVDALLRAGGYRNGSPATCRIRLYEGVLAPGGRVGAVGEVERADAAARAAGAVVVVRARAVRAEPA